MICENQNIAARSPWCSAHGSPGPVLRRNVCGRRGCHGRFESACSMSGRMSGAQGNSQKQPIGLRQRNRRRGKFAVTGLKKLSASFSCATILPELKGHKFSGMPGFTRLVESILSVGTASRRSKHRRKGLAIRENHGEALLPNSCFAVRFWNQQNFEETVDLLREP